MCDTVRMQPGRRSTSDPMFIRVSPLFVYLHSQYFHIWHFESPVVGFSPLFVYLNPQYFHIRHIWSAVVYRSASVSVRHCADATWWKIHHRPHVYKGFPFICLSTLPIFSYLTFWVARCEAFRLAENTQYYASIFIADPPKKHAQSMCIGIQTPCLSRVPLCIHILHSFQHHLYIFCRPL